MTSIMTSCRGAALLAGLLLMAGGAAAEPLLDEMDPAKFGNEVILRDARDPAKYPQFAAEIEAAATYPTNYAGTVFLDGKPAAGIRVTDGMDFVTTDADGRYRIAITPDAMQPYLPSRSVFVSWPDNTFPARDKRTGDWLWWRRLEDVKDTPERVDFFLETRRYTPPLVIAFASDPHDNLWEKMDQIWPAEIAQAGRGVDFAVLGGDLTYAEFKGADIAFGQSMRGYTRAFPVPLFHVQGNHDFTAPMFGPHLNAGLGAFARYLNPIRWSFDACGVHIVSLNYWLINRDSLRWLRRDLDAVPPDRPIYLFTHMWGEYLDEFCEQYNIRLVQAGHSHTTMPHGTVGSAEFWTYCCFYRLIYIDREEFEFVERDVAVNPLYRYSRQNWTPGGARAGLTNLTVRSRAVAIPNLPASAHYDVEFTVAAKESDAQRWGLRIVTPRGYVVPFTCDARAHTLNLAGRETYFSIEPVTNYAFAKAKAPVGEDGVVQFRINVQPDRIHVNLNDRISYETFLGLGPAERIEFFAEEGAARLLSANVWGTGSAIVDWQGYKKIMPTQNQRLWEFGK